MWEETRYTSVGVQFISLTKMISSSAIFLQTKKTEYLFAIE